MDPKTTFNPGLADVGCGMFYKVDSLAVDKDIALISQVLLALWVYKNYNFLLTLTVEHL